MRIRPFLLTVALLALPSASLADYINNFPTTNLSANAPVVITQSSIFVPKPPTGTDRICVSFRNVSNKTASSVRVTFKVDDALGQPLREAVLNRNGEFSPGIAIEGKMDSLGGNADSFNNCVHIRESAVAASRVTLDVTEVGFADGTTWKKGDSFTRVYDRSGDKVASTTVGSGSPGMDGATNATVNIGGATATGGVIGPRGNVYGTIAWLRGSRTAVGAVANAATQSDADFQAMTKCTALAPGNTGCEPVVRIWGANRCGAISTDDTRYSTARGPDMNSTIQAALEALQKQGGTLGSNNIVSSICNAH